jgi:hypothetical protein
MEAEFISLEEIFSGNYSDDRGVLSALDKFAENYIMINNIEGRRWHNRNVFSFLKEIFIDGEVYDEKRIIFCYRYYLDKREEILNRKGYGGDLI